MKTLFVSDLDGTLLTREERISPYSCEVLNKLISSGMLFTYATARSALSARRAVEGLAVNAPVILYNGGLIYNFYTQEVIRSVIFSADLKYYILTVLKDYGILPIVFSSHEGKERMCWTEGQESSGMSRYLYRRRDDKRLVPARSDGELLDGDVYYFKCIGPFEQLERVWNVLKYDTRIICIFHQETYQNDFWLEISPREATKANAVRFLKEKLGCEKVVCFGDTSNDSDMFDVCDEKYAVMNADEWLKRKATGVIGYCEEDGVAKWLDAYSGF